MGCDIHTIAEVRRDGCWHAVGQYEWFAVYSDVDPEDAPFEWRHYAMFAFLAGVRNYEGIEPIVEPRGMPPDASHEALAKRSYWVGHTPSFVTLRELVEFDYDRPMSKISSATYREVLGDRFFLHLKSVQRLGAPDDVRVVFFFNN